jgi:hypothetical protein
MKKEPLFVFDHVRPGWGYEPGDIVTPEFAGQYPQFCKPLAESRPEATSEDDES